MKDIFEFPEPERRQGVTEKAVGRSSLPKRARSNKYTRGSWSFRLKEDNGYAYWQEFYQSDVKYYRVLFIEDQDLLEMLDYWDRQEEKADRQSFESGSFSYINFLQTTDGADPMDRAVYEEWAQKEDSARGKKLPVKAELAVIHSIIISLSPTDQRVYRYMFEENMTDAQIKQAFELEHSAWSNEKKRFLNKVRNAFIELGYEVPGLEELKKQAKVRDDAIKRLAAAREKEAAAGRLEKSIAREIRRMESTTKPRAFASEEQEEEDRIGGLTDYLVNELDNRQ